MLDDLLDVFIVTGITPRLDGRNAARAACWLVSRANTTMITVTLVSTTIQTGMTR
jgi:hypothetical protein